MAIIGGFDRTRHFDELNEPLDSQEGVLSPSVRRARAIFNLFAGESDPGVRFENGITADDDVYYPVVINGVPQAINANGAISIATYATALTTVTTTGQTFTMADGTYIGQLKRIHLVADGADGTVTFNGTATLVFADVGDYALLLWDGEDWTPVDRGNEASGDAGPAYTPAA